MKRIVILIMTSFAFVIGGTLIIYSRLSTIDIFWDSQTIWNFLLALCWIVVAFGYFHQGWLVRSGHTVQHVSTILPATVFVVQCILFIKGVYYGDWALMFGAVVVNSGTVFALYHILKTKRLSSHIS